MQELSATLLDMTASPYWVAAAGAVASAYFVRRSMHFRRLWQAARDDHQNGRALIENLSEGIYRSSIDGRQLSANAALVKLNGYDSEQEMLEAVQDIATEWYVEPGRRDQFRMLLQRDGQVTDFVSEVYRHKTRERIWITESARVVRHSRTGAALYYEGSVREITETVKRLQLEQRYKKLIDQVPGGLFQYSRDKSGIYRVTYSSEGFRRITGMPADEPFNTPEPFLRLIHPDDIEAYNQSLRDCYRAMKGWEHEFRIRTPAGEEKWLRATAAPEISGDLVIWHGYCSDISLRKRHEIEIRDLAFFDPLTRLPNRRMLLDRLAVALPERLASKRRGALLFIDLDNFKTLNDTQGHDVGDAYLVQVSERLKSCVRPIDLVARMGGDEFVLVLEDAGEDEAAATARAITVASQVLKRLATEFQIGDVSHISSASVGIVIYDGGEARVDEVLKRADIAMYKAKAAGRNAMAIFDPASMARENERYRMIAELRTAVAENHFRLHFQPQVDRFGDTCAAEALLRWYHPEQGIIKPDRFIPLAEQSGLINEIGKLVLVRGVETLAQWQANPLTAHLRLSINVSVKSFGAEDFLPHLTKLIERHRIDPSKLTLEFTEHVMAENHAFTASRMRELKRLGISFSLDDFGTGYSSLAYLRQLPFDEVKIDGSFVADIETKESDRALVRTILAMADTLGLVAVAEHVENSRQEAFLRSFGCDVYQGYLYSPPMEAELFVERLRAEAQPGPKPETTLLRAG